MKKLLSCIVISTMFLGSAVFAAQQSDGIKWIPGIPPIYSQKQVTLPLDKRMKANVRYTVKCYIKKADADIPVLLGPTGIKIYIDVKSVNGQGTFEKIPNVNRYTAENVSKNTKLTFQKKVADYHFSFEECIAWPFQK